MAHTNAARFSYVQSGQPQEHNCLLKVWVSAAETSAKATAYTLTVKSIVSGQAWSVNRRYSEFLSFRDRLLHHYQYTRKSKCPGCLSLAKAVHEFDFPRKHLLSSRSQQVIRFRVKALRSFARMIAGKLFSNTPKCTNCGNIPFQMTKAFFAHDATPLGNSSAEGIKDSMVVEQFVSRESVAVHKKKGYWGSNSLSENFSEPATAATSSSCDASVPSITTSEDSQGILSPKRKKIDNAEESPRKRPETRTSKRVDVDEVQIDFHRTRIVSPRSQHSKKELLDRASAVKDLWKPWELVNPDM